MTKLTETRFAYGDALLKLGGENSKIVVLDADLYKSTRTVVFKETYPDRFFDMGISESDMVSTAAGLASTGLIPYCNSFAMFLPGVCYMPIRTQIAYPQLPVRLVGSSAGLTQGPDGASHQSLEDISLMRGLPNMTVLSPADDIETTEMTLATATMPGPVYLRVGRYPVPRVMPDDYRFQVGKAHILRSGGEVAILATGHMVWKALEAADLLAQAHIAATVVNVSTIKPLDISTVRAVAGQVALVVTVEEHNIIGGLGSAIAECLAESATRARLVRLGVKDVFGESGLADELLEKHGLQPQCLAASIETACTHFKDR
ncbi:MAG: transketolase family protein [Chloroflexi bacterium]|nr:transketolase family protein [Chloroflexota bacterium]